jgi:hypothetical protein
MVTKAPVIGPFARAFDIGATAVAGIAKLFGFSNAPIVSDVVPHQPKAFHAMANVETSVPLDKLSLDPDNSVTIDNTVTGYVKEDPLAIAGIVTRESYIAQTDWTAADAEGTKLFTVAVTPALIRTESGAASSLIVYGTPSSFVADFFKFWRGSLVLKIKIVKSSYHKGRILVHWDPHQIAAYGSETAVFTQVIDLADEQSEYEIVVPYKAAPPMLNCATESAGITVRGDCTVNRNMANGAISVYVQNKLTGPTVDPTVGVLLFWSSAEDMTFGGTDVPNNNQSLVAVQSGSMDQSAVKVDEHMGLITTGENVASLRQILHRASLSFSQPVGCPMTGTGTYVGKGHLMNMNLLPRTPPEYGYYSRALFWGSKKLTTGSAPFNFAVTHPINTVLSAFVGYRGSTNVFVNVTSPDTLGPVPSVSISRCYEDYDLATAYAGRNRWTLQSDGTKTTVALRNLSVVGNYNFRGLGTSGMSLTHQSTQGGLNVNIPQYSQWRFQPAWGPYRDLLPDNSNRTMGIRLLDNARVDTCFVSSRDTEVTTWPIMDVYYSAGVDFQPVWFVGVPKKYAFVPPNADDSYQPSTS